MKRLILSTLAAATILTPVASQAAEMAPRASATAIEDSASFQRDGRRGENRDGEGRRGEGRRGDGEGRRGGNEGRGGEARRGGNEGQGTVNPWRQRSDDGNRRERPRVDVREQRPDASQDGRYYDRNRDGNLDRRWDRNRDDRLDRNWDRNRDGRLDRRFDRNDDERIDRRYDRNRNGDLDRRWDRNNDNRVDRTYRGGQNGGGQWNNSWRNDRRYDWRCHRNRYRSYYSPGRYYSPFRSHRYSRLTIGFHLGSPFYGSSYWINDPWHYRLPSHYGPYRWVRYYDDVLLVDLRSGRVVDVIYDFFW